MKASWGVSQNSDLDQEEEHAWEEEYRQAQTTTEQQVDSLTSAFSLPRAVYRIIER